MKATSGILLGSAAVCHGLANANRQLGQGKGRLLCKSVLKMFRAGISAFTVTPAMATHVGNFKTALCSGR